MYTYDQAMGLLAQMQAEGRDAQEIAWSLALACIGWPYIFGDRGAKCTPAHRRAAYASKGAEHPTIKSKCKNFEGTGTCTGCKFYPGGITLAFDCRGFTYWILLKVYSWKLMGAGATTQWNTASNWAAKGEISTMPKNTLCCLFVQNGSKMSHTGFGLNDETIECSSGVQHFTKRKAKWTHWGVPVCVSGEVKPVDPDPDPTPEPDPVPVPVPPKEDRPTLRRGDSGPYVVLAQTELINRAYDLGSYGADGKFGAKTEAAVKLFQQDWGLTADGIIGPVTWQKLDQAPVRTTYTVTIKGCTESQAKELKKQYPQAEMIPEGSLGIDS